MSLVANHPTLTHVVSMLEKTTGRDKILRTIQYFSRFFAYVLFKKGATKESIAFWKHLQAQVALSRKLFRVGKPFNHLKLAAKAYANKTQDPVLRTTAVLRNVFYTGYFSIDSLVWLNTSKVYQIPNFKPIQKLGSRLWLIGIIFNLINSLRRYQLATFQESALLSESEKDSAQLKKVQIEKAAATHQFVWDALDSSIPTFALDLAPGLLDDGIVGLFGLITSIFGLKQQWRITA
ncbi:uncharacterized protein SAPINGB_P001809 [Magnusiomyces paraingens]|uniref:Peroxisomal biogenesis factor 11 n=1 Tax=Magnusiomyces paraingens TaxID=2606893 RepID=A0A5E8BBB7_9ASCO|nr:uncharacterized protein SAPINGB_P001809 [Saprochaete ingens]VVT48499.1 unnamed protein product [Saprochaete ingens]